MEKEEDKQFDEKNVIEDISDSKRKKRKWIFISSLIIIFVLVLMVSMCFIIFTFYLEVKQRADLFFIETSIELFNSEFNNYPPSEAMDPTGKPYCGAMKLCEALLGQDIKGFNKDSVFRSDGLNSDGTVVLYSDNPEESNLSSRKSLYSTMKQTQVSRLKDVYKKIDSFEENEYVLCDIYKKKRYSGKKIGMPVLYYKADTSKSSHDINNPDNPDNIYNYKDNYDLLALGVPGKPGIKHPLYEDPSLFYIMTQKYSDTSKSTPVKKDSYILISAGRDGLYGTKDDITNFLK